MLVNCKNCERAFNQVGPERLCPVCRETYVKLFQYITDHPAATLPEISQAVGIGVGEIRLFLRQGRFVAFEHLRREMLRCIRCGRPPDRGELCQACLEELVAELGEELEPGAHGDPEKNQQSTAKDSDKSLR